VGNENEVVFTKFDVGLFSRKLLRVNLGDFIPLYYSGIANTVHTNTVHTNTFHTNTVHTNTIQKFYTFVFIFTTCWQGAGMAQSV